MLTIYRKEVIFTLRERFSQSRLAWKGYVVSENDNNLNQTTIGKKYPKMIKGKTKTVMVGCDDEE